MRTRTLIAGLTGLTLALTAPLAQAGESRQSSAGYITPGASSRLTVVNRPVQVESLTILNRRTGPISFPTEASEASVRFSVADAAGAKVGGEVHQLGARGQQLVIGSFCGQSGALRLARAGEPVTVTLRTCGGSVPASTGSVSAAFSR